MAQVRRARTDALERARLEEICLLTGAAGGDATQLLDDPTLLTDAYLTPYLALEPDLCLVLVDDADIPVGYAIGAADTAAFEARCAAWWPVVRARHGTRTRPPRPGLEQHLVERLDGRNLTDPRLLDQFPAHLHIDLLSTAQGGGNGRLLITALLDALREAGARGVHLGVDPANTRALGFYRHLGFAEVPHANSLVLGLPL
ncbi:GNAT family N-acetyltransferase [Sanguibacter hominis ATCC BAA-789]|uniref:GNAT family N-acetyltransferase n=1 Tax=Sanguibacter hominis ATCC BAA-789 TaxID=1312740 RepID=A0A9X5FAK6_9MICO|nr:GNAT family N-acetyltransferase [Sanguibacter hominis]NKX92503.1 GNAT family N-acetyltransferase [Sanguibacter hominis ATCC BAA-789]